MQMTYIDTVATGKNINDIRKSAGLSVKEIQTELGFSTPNAIYKWIHGETLPTIDNLVILSQILNVSMDNIIIRGN